MDTLIMKILPFAHQIMSCHLTAISTGEVCGFTLIFDDTDTADSALVIPKSVLHPSHPATI